MQTTGRQAQLEPDGARVQYDRHRADQTTLYRLVVQVGFKADEADSGAVTLIQRFGSAANLNIHLHCLVLDGVYRRGEDGVPEFFDVPAPSDQGT